jgi:hypothetical protein
MKNLENVSLVVVDCVDYDRAKLSIDYCRSKLNFGEVKLLTHFEIDDTVIEKIPKITSIDEYSQFMVRDLANHFIKDFVLVAQWDGFIWHQELWDDEFLKYDYIGAPWYPDMLQSGVPKHFLVGNGGFSLRSKRLQEFLRDNFNNLLWHKAEDVVICQYNRNYLESNGFVFAPHHIAEKFSKENGPMDPAFGVHARLKLVKI